MSEVNRYCCNADGSPKRSYPTKRLAKRAMRWQMAAGVKGLCVYRCPCSIDHGYHLGHC